MDITNPQRAKVLVHALPYIQEYSGKIVVIKYGGNAMISAKLKDSVMRDIVLLSLIGVKVVLVHGGGPEITETLEKLGKQTQFVDGLRVTDAETADVVQMVLAGKINKTLVNLIGHKGGRAIGLSGIDGQMIQARVRDERLGYVGEITKVDVRPILDVIDKGYIPVVSTVGCDTQGHVYNINADTAAARIAGELGAESLIAMTDISGILRDKDDPSTLIPVIHTVALEPDRAVAFCLAAVCVFTSCAGVAVGFTATVCFDVSKDCCDVSLLCGSTDCFGASVLCVLCSSVVSLSRSASDTTNSRLFCSCAVT